MSPSSADTYPNELDNHVRRGKPTGTGPPKRSNNAEIHGMDGSVTPRAIAYAAAQVCGSHYLSTQLTLLPAPLKSHGCHPLDGPL